VGRLGVEVEATKEEAACLGHAQAAAKEEDAEVAMEDTPRRRLVAVGLVSGEPWVIGAGGWLAHPVIRVP
jgi:hypothetical protein